MNVIMMGPPGAGKGTQASRLAAARGLLKISTGDMLRDAVREQHPVALAAKAKMDRGELVDDETMIQIVRDRLMKPDARKGVVLDGFPRTVAQAEALDAILQERGDDPLVILDVEVPQDELVRRLATRKVCSKCGATPDPADPAATCRRCGGQLEQRADDNQEVVLERLKVYARSTQPVLEYYRERPTFRVVNGAQPPDLVGREIEAMVDDAVAAASR